MARIGWGAVLPRVRWVVIELRRRASTSIDSVIIDTKMIGPINVYPRPIDLTGFRKKAMQRALTVLVLETFRRLKAPVASHQWDQRATIL
jgi:hypothetical protein